MSLSRLILAGLLVLLVMAGCGKDSENPVDTGNSNNPPADPYASMYGYWAGRMNTHDDINGDLVDSLHIFLDRNSGTGLYEVDVFVGLSSSPAVAPVISVRNPKDFRAYLFGYNTLFTLTTKSGYVEVNLTGYTDVPGAPVFYLIGSSNVYKRL